MKRRLVLTTGLMLMSALSLALVLIGLGTSPARADGPAGADPSQNFPAGPVPVSCELHPTAPACIDSAVSYLDQARASLGQGPYVLPSNFDALPAEQQAFVLTNLDRVLYGLPPIPGLTAALGRDAAQGVSTDSDPMASDPDVISYTSNWAGGFLNMPYAYGAWMYDDGLGSGHLDCTPADAGGCWGHRHDVLWRFDSPGPLAMGAASGKDSVGRPGYAMLLVEGDSAYKPVYSYTWAEAVANGARPAGGPVATVARAAATVRITVHGPGRVVDQRGDSCSAGACSSSEPPGTRARLSAKPGTTATFAGWSGACGGKTGCTVTPTRSTTSVTATFIRPLVPAAGREAAPRIARVTVSGHTLVVAIVAPSGARLQCALTDPSGRNWDREIWRACSSPAVYHGLAHGHYRLRVRSRARDAGRFVTTRAPRLVIVP